MKGFVTFKCKLAKLERVKNVGGDKKPKNNKNENALDNANVPDAVFY